jgi:tetratricopeptide (TPR) repeat protein
MNRIISFVLFCLVFSAHDLSAQRTAYYSDPDQLYKTGLELFDKQQYGAAQKSFVDFSSRTKSSLLKADGLFYAAACGIELTNRDGEWMMKRFIESYPASTKINLAYFYLGKSAFRKKKYPETLEFLENVDVYKLDKEQRAEYYFKRGYSHLQNNADDKALADFYEIKDTDNKYAQPATYYYSHIAYKHKNYEMALGGFNRLVKSESFGSVVPYYITQIYFIQAKYDKVTAEAPGLLKDSVNVQREGEINRMIGESYFNQKRFESALPYLKKASIGNARDNYAIAFCYYKTGDYANAVRYFEPATAGSDSVSQNAWYHLADCQIRLNEKSRAKNAFYAAYQQGFNKVIAEDALFSFAKLSYELDFNPYNDAVRAFSKYLSEFPQSNRKDEVYGYLVNVYSTTRNYDQAIKSIESLKSVDVMLKVTYQRLVYFLGVERFNNNDLVAAEKEFKKSLSLNSDPVLNSLNQYWLGEIYYIRKDYSTAIDAWKKFQVMDASVRLKEYDLSNYALGYAYFQRKNGDDYTNANYAFRKFLMTRNTYDDKKIADATVRTADCYFMNRDFVQASENYKNAIAKNQVDVDYCLYQKALCDGLMKNYTEKVSELKKIETQYPKSNYMAAALNEIAETYHNNLKDYDNAIAYYEKIMAKYPNSSYVGNGYAQIGNIYYELKKDDKAFEYYDKYIRIDNKSEMAKNILDAIKKIFDAKGDIEGQKKYFESIGNPLSENEIEKKTYLVAYDAFYTQKNCDLAMPKWEAYINQFPNGKYIAEAQFQYAECAYSKNMYDKAVPGYLFVIGRPRTIYHETALAKTSWVFYKDKRYEEALPLFTQLEELAETPSNKSAGRFGTMRCAFYLKKYDVALEACNRVMNTEKLSPQQTAEAKYIHAKSLYETGRLDDALTEFKALVKTVKNTTGAEAYYHIAKIHFARQNYKEVENTINKMVSYEYSNDDWNNRAMLLLADAYIARKEYQDAQVIIQTIIDSKPKQEYLDEATKKQEALKTLQENRASVPETPGLNLELKNKKDSVLTNPEQPK